jgi:hypothetical protein
MVVLEYIALEAKKITAWCVMCIHSPSKSRGRACKPPEERFQADGRRQRASSPVSTHETKRTVSRTVILNGEGSHYEPNELIGNPTRHHNARDPVNVESQLVVQA